MKIMNYFNKAEGRNMNNRGGNPRQKMQELLQPQSGLNMITNVQPLRG